MKVEIQEPAEVQERLTESYGALAVYADEIAELGMHARTLDNELLQYQELLINRRRGLGVKQAGLKNYDSANGRSPEAEKQRRETERYLNNCEQMLQKLRSLREENCALARQSKQLHTETIQLVAAWKAVVLRARGIIDSFLKAL